RQRMPDRLEDRSRAVALAEREPVRGEIDLGVVDDLGIPDGVRQRGRPLVVLAGAGRAPELRVDPAERVQETARPRTVADPAADLGRLRQPGERAAVVAETAVRLA